MIGFVFFIPFIVSQACLITSSFLFVMVYPPLNMAFVDHGCRLVDITEPEIVFDPFQMTGQLFNVNICFLRKINVNFSMQAHDKKTLIFLRFTGSVLGYHNCPISEV